jgi:hypothetical protein
LGFVRAALRGARKVAKPDQRDQAQHADNRNNDDRSQETTGPTGRLNHTHFVVIAAHSHRMSRGDFRSESRDVLQCGPAPTWFPYRRGRGTGPNQSSGNDWLTPNNRGGELMFQAAQRGQHQPLTEAAGARASLAPREFQFAQGNGYGKRRLSG